MPAADRDDVSQLYEGDHAKLAHILFLLNSTNARSGVEFDDIFLQNAPKEWDNWMSYPDTVTLTYFVESEEVEGIIGIFMYNKYDWKLYTLEGLS